MLLDGSNHVGSHRKVRLLGAPVLVKQRDGFAGGVENQPLREHCFGGEMREFVFRELGNSLVRLNLNAAVRSGIYAIVATKSYAGARAA